MTYCGYVDILMVIMLITFLNLVLILILLFMLILSNFSFWVLSIKVFSNGFFGDMELILNSWSLLFLFMVVMISSSVMVFSFSYMSSLMVSNFLWLYLGFVFSMVWLIMNGNFFWMMLGWDGLGVVSFLLILFYMNYESINNGLFTMFQNRLGDMFLVLFMIGILDMSLQLNLFLKWGVLFLIIGASVKSAQFPFNSWLLAAMSAPTPISSLVHSSTLVVAGVYILLQFSYCLSGELSVLKYIALLSLLVSSFGLLNEMDMKKLIAYSTMSHVSLMMYMLSMELFKVVYFHLNIHAMFKSLMFMCFGFVMLTSFHGQDKRLISLLSLNPLAKIMYYFSCFCLMGLPFLSGFFSKDLMIEKVMNSVVELVWVLFLILFLAISIYYGLKLMNLSFKGASYMIIEKYYLGQLSIYIMFTIMIFFINMYLSLMLSLSLEIISMKLYIYFFILILGLMSLWSNLNYKYFGFDKMKSFKEVWVVNVYLLDSFVYWTMFNVMSYINMISSYKLIFLLNWWVLVLTIFIF